MISIIRYDIFQLKVALPFIWVLGLIGAHEPLFTQTPTCQQAFTLGPDQILCFPETYTEVVAISAWEVLKLDWNVSSGPVSIDSASWSVLTTGTETLIATAEIRSPNMIVNGDFSAGNTGFTSTMLSSPFTLIIPGSYAIVTNPASIHPDFKPCQDHTSGSGLMLACNGSLLANRDIWCQNVAVDPGGVYDLSFWGSAATENESPELVFRIDGQNLGTYNVLGPVTCEWIETKTTWMAALQTSVQVCIRNLNGSNSGNDFVLDDIVMQERCMISDTVIVRHIPQKQSNLDTLLCEGTSIIVGGQVIQQSGMDTIYVTDFWGCDSTIVVHAQVWNPDLTIAMPDTLTCHRDEVVLTSSIQPGPGILTLSWTDPAGNAIPGGSAIQNVQVPGLYTLTAVLSSTLGTCTVTSEQTVIQNVKTPLANAGQDMDITCLTDSVMLSTSPVVPNTTTLWTWLSGQGQPQTPGTTIIVRDTGTYLVEVTDLTNGCTHSDSVVIGDKRQSPGGLEFSLQGPVCEGGNGQIVIQDLSTGQDPFDLILQGPHGDIWNDFVVQGLDGGDYVLMVTDANGCQWDTLLTLPEVVVPNMQLPFGLVAKGGEFINIKPVLDFSDSLVTAYIWSTSNLILDCQTCANIQVSGLEGGILTLCVQLGPDCEICDQTYISFDEPWTIFSPTAFSPNEDGINDFFRPVLNADVVIKMESLVVFDRWGNQVYAWSGGPGNLQTGEWNGFIGSELAPSSVYVYSCQIRLINGQIKNIEGEVQLIR